MWSDWYAAYLACDPPGDDMFPRFQVWDDHEWTDYQAGVSKSLLDEQFAEVDLGTFEGVAYKYEVHVVDDLTWVHEDVESAVNNVKRHKNGGTTSSSPRSSAGKARSRTRARRRQQPGPCAS